MKFFLLLMLSLFLSTNSQAQCISGNCDDGEGTYIYKDNSSYTGDFKKGLAHGYGKCNYSNGNSYEGHWQEHKFHGEGSFFESTGKSTRGIWEVGILKKVIQVTEQEVPKTWAVIVGVAAYNHMPRLQYTDDDAYKMYAFLKSPEGGAIPDERMNLMIDENATKENIINAMRDLAAKVGHEDVLIFYFSGHGEENSLLPYDYDGLYNRLTYQEINVLLKMSNAKHKICLTDACYSGSMIAMKGIDENGNDNSNAKSKNNFDVFSQENNEIAVLVSSQADEKSVESNRLRQGTFSHFLIKGLKGDADRDRNNIITISELYKYVHRQVKSYTENRQTPSLFGRYDPDMPIGKVRGVAKVMSN